jgi:hypothetical protein
MKWWKQEASMMGSRSQMLFPTCLVKWKRLIVAGMRSLLSRLLLRQQLADFHAGQTVGNHVDPAQLSRLEREELVEALKAIDRLRKRARADFTGAFW